MARIVIISSFAESLLKFRGELVRSMAAMGQSVTAYAPDFTPETAEGLTRLGARARTIYMERTGVNPTQDVRTLLSLTGALREDRPDIVLSYTIKPVIYGSLAARAAKRPKVYSLITGLGYSFLKDGLKRRIMSGMIKSLYRLSLRHNAKVFFQNPDDRDLFVNEGILNDLDQAVLVDGSGVDLDHYGPVPLPEKPTFLLIARLIRDKGIVEYAEAARIVRRKYPEAKFRLVGWIDDNPAAIPAELLDGWAREGLVEHLGLLRDVRPAIADSRVYVLPSYYREGVPRSVLEAMSMGRPIITTNAPGCRETVQDGVNGFLVEPRDSSSLAQAMERLIRERALAEEMGRRSREIAERRFDVRKVNALMLRTMEISDEQAHVAPLAGQARRHADERKGDGYV